MQKIKSTCKFLLWIIIQNNTDEQSDSSSHIYISCSDLFPGLQRIVNPAVLQISPVNLLPKQMSSLFLQPCCSCICKPEICSPLSIHTPIQLLKPLSSTSSSVSSSPSPVSALEPHNCTLNFCSGLLIGIPSCCTSSSILAIKGYPSVFSKLQMQSHLSSDWNPSFSPQPILIKFKSFRYSTQGPSWLYTLFLQTLLSVLPNVPLYPSDTKTTCDSPNTSCCWSSLQLSSCHFLPHGAISSSFLLINLKYIYSDVLNKLK